MFVLVEFDIERLRGFFLVNKLFLIILWKKKDLFYRGGKIEKI